ncbi:MAG: hypothetical protein HOW73_45125 [Polyangiaceae bacterium]|nr:hypothetical protein [Polyangiaceae bacterium]
MTVSPRAFVARTSALRIETARRFVEGHLAEKGSKAECLVVGPNRPAIDELAIALTFEHQAVFGLHRKTLSGLATECAALALSLDGKTPATSIVLEALARIVARTELQAGSLEHFGRPSTSGPPVADTPGFALCLARTLAELDREDVDLDALAGAAPNAKDLAVLAKELRRGLAEQRLATRADVFRVAAANMERTPLAGLPVVLLDVPVRDRVECLLIERVLASAPDAVVLIPAGDHRTMRAMRAMRIDIAELEEPDTGATLSRFRHRLVAADLEDASRLSDKSVSLRSAPSESLEAVEIARLLLDESARGVPFDEMAVLIPSRETYASHLASAFGRAGIPARFETGARRPHPAGRALLALLKCRAQRGSGRRLFEYLSTAQMPRIPVVSAEIVLATDSDLGRFGGDADAIDRDEDPSDEDDAAAIAFRPPPLRKWIRMLGEIGISRARQAGSIASYIASRIGIAKEEILAARAGLEWEEADDDARPSEAQSRADRACAELDELWIGLSPILEGLDRVPLRGTWAAFARAIGELATIALKRPAPIQSLMVELEALATSDSEVDLDEVLAILDPRLRWLERAGTRAVDEGRAQVVVTAIDSMRGRARRVAVVAGLAEGLFPARTREDPLLADEARDRVGLPTVVERTADERLRLYVAAGAAKERLYLTYPRYEAATGRPRVPSVFAMEVARAIDGRLPSLDQMERAATPPSRILLSWPAPHSTDNTIDDFEYSLAKIRDLRGRKDASMKGRARFLIEANPVLLRALRARWLRHNAPRFTASDGFFATQPATRTLLASHRLSTRAYAPSALEAYAACPYRFYLRSLAGLSRRAVLEEVDRLDPLLFGDLYHQCQAMLGSKLAALDIDPQLPESRDRVIAEIRSIVRAVGERAMRRFEPIVERVFESEMARIEADLVGFAEEEIARGDGYRPHRAELSFGLPRHRHLAPESVEEPVRVSGGYRLKGAIDSVERDAQGRLRITDYKTGRVPEERRKGVTITGGGEMLQPLLYALAVENLRGRAVASDDVVAACRLYYATRRGAYESVHVAVASDNVAKAIRVLDTIDMAVEKGIFVAAPREGACERCAYRAVCGPNEEARTKQKQPGPTTVERDIFESLRDIRRVP